MKHPIESIVWRSPFELNANHYNPNHVLDKEMKLLEFSIMKSGWVQAILITQDDVIIDGFHRVTVARVNNWKVPCAVMNLSEAERIMLTIRINRAKGSHVALKMASIMKHLVHGLGVPTADICKGIGCDKSEVELLLLEDVFEKEEIAQHQYSKAWYPK